MPEPKITVTVQLPLDVDRAVREYQIKYQLSYRETVIALLVLGLRTQPDKEE